MIVTGNPDDIKFPLKCRGCGDTWDHFAERDEPLADSFRGVICPLCWSDESQIVFNVVKKEGK